MTDRPVTLRLRPFAPTLAVQAAHFGKTFQITRRTYLSDCYLTPIWRMPADRWVLPSLPWFARGLAGPTGRTMRTERRECLTPAASAPQSTEVRTLCQAAIPSAATWYGPCDVCPFVDSCNPCAVHGCKEDLYQQMAQER